MTESAAWTLQRLVEWAVCRVVLATKGDSFEDAMLRVLGGAGAPLAIHALAMVRQERQRVKRCAGILEFLNWVGPSAGHLGEGSAVSAAALAEYLAAELLEVSRMSVRREREAIDRWHIWVAIADDDGQELTHLFAGAPCF
jgi:hypothetical protein